MRGRAPCRTSRRPRRTPLRRRDRRRLSRSPPSCREPQTASCWAGAPRPRRKSRPPASTAFRPASSRSRKRRHARGIRRAAAAAAAAAPKPAMAATFSVPARAPRSCPPPLISGSAMWMSHRGGSARRRPAGRRSCATTSVIGRRRARRCRNRCGRQPAPRRRAAGHRRRARCRRSRAIGWITPVSLLASITETSGRSRPSKGASQRVKIDHAVAGDRQLLDRLGAKRPPLSTEGCSIAETNSRSRRRLSPADVERRRQRQHIGFGGAAGEGHVLASAPTSAATWSRAFSTSGAPRALPHGPRTALPVTSKRAQYGGTRLRTQRGSRVPVEIGRVGHRDLIGNVLPLRAPDPAKCLLFALGIVLEAASRVGL